jgi:hypothetical protein
VKKARQARRGSLRMFGFCFFVFCCILMGLSYRIVSLPYLPLFSLSWVCSVLSYSSVLTCSSPSLANVALPRLSLVSSSPHTQERKARKGVAQFEREKEKKTKEKTGWVIEAEKEERRGHCKRRGRRCLVFESEEEGKRGRGGKDRKQHVYSTA